MSANEEILNAAIRHSIISERYGKGLARKIVALLDAADVDLTDQLEKRLARIADGRDNGPATTRKLSEVIDALRTINSSVYRKLAGVLEAELIDMAAVELDGQAATLERALPVTVNAVAPTATYLKTLVTMTPVDGHLLGSWVDNMASNRLRRVEQALRIGMIEGQTVDQLVRRIRGTRAARYKDGILEISRRSATTLALTANSTIANAARQEVFKANAKLIDKLKWVATLDSRTSPGCQSKDGQLYEIGKAPACPAHPRCRSIIIPVTVPFNKLGLDASDYSPTSRASMDGQVPANVTFGDWLKKQPRSRVEEIYGKERAELFLSGKVKFADLYKDDGSFYSLAELRRRTPTVAPKPTPVTAPKPPVRTLEAINADNDADLKAYTLAEGRKNGKEHLAIYDAATGKTYPHVTDGKKGSVAFPPWMMDELKNPARQIVLHHNHPSSNSFSPADLSVIHDLAGAKGIWAHGHNGSSYYAEVGARKMSLQGYRLLQNQTKRWLQAKVNARKVAADDAGVIFFHVVSMLADHRGYIKYSADLKGPSLEAFNRTKPEIEAFLSTITPFKA